ncbi:MAG: hypothetical protein IH623_19815 [Verrucomicrobia bacterium]|nr:hypothetical protein [Verrucomicrobiota bacterium]
MSFALFSTVPLSAADVTNTVVVAVSGDASPQGVGELADHEPPVLGNGGMAAFAANIRQGTTKTGSGIFLGDGTNLLGAALEGDSAPNQDGVLGAFTTLVSTPRINAANQVAFRNSLGSTAIQGGGHGLFVADPSTSQIRELARSNTDTPFGSGTYENATFNAFYTFNDAGQSALSHRALFQGYLSFLGGIFRLDGTVGGNAEIAIPGQPAPVDGDTFTIAGSGAVNAFGQVLFWAGTASGNVGLFELDGGDIRQRMRVGDPTPGGDGDFGFFNPTINASTIAFNDQGQVGIIMRLSNTSGGLANDDALYRLDPSSAVELIREGDPAPDGNGEILAITSMRIALNNAGQILFPATFAGATNGASWGLFIADDTGITQIVRGNDPAPGGGTFSSLPSGAAELALNDAGQVVFQASVRGNDGFVRTGLFFYDPDEGLLSVIRHGDTFPGLGTMSGLNFYGGTGIVGSEGSGLNDLGQVAYRAFVGAYRVVAIWSGPRRSAPSQPILRTEWTEGGLLRISWDELDETWKLTAADQPASTNWNEVDIEPVGQDGVRSVELPLSQPAQFFRLSKEAGTQ